MYLLALSFVIAFILILYILWEYYRRNGDVNVAIAKTMVVLGSGISCLCELFVGGHTSEMISLIKHLDSKLYNPFVFVYADTDNKSIQRVQDANVHNRFDCNVDAISLYKSYYSSKQRSRSVLFFLYSFYFKSICQLHIHGL